jgi:prolyl oligopeptidase
MKMKKWLPFVIVIVFFYACKQETRMQYPVTKKVDTTDVYFGMKVPDPYRWLEDDNSEETKAWVKAQNEVTSAYLAKIPFREKIRERFTKMWNYERQSFLKKESGIYYFDGNNGLQNQNVIYYKKSLDSESKVLLDPNTLSKEGTSALNTSAISSDGKYFAYAISKSGSDWSEIFIKEIETGKLLSDHLLWVKFSGIAWDREGIYYSRYDEPKENKGLTQKNEFQKVYYHKLGTDQKDDKLIIKSDEPTVMYGAQVTEDRNYLIVYESKWGFDGNKIFIKEIASKKEFKAIGTGYENEYSVAGNWGSTFYIVTNASAPKRKVVSWDLNGKGEPVSVVAEKDYLLEGVALNGTNTIIAQYLKDAHTKVEIYDAKGAYKKDMKLPALGTVAELSSRAGEKDLIYTFTSFTYPTASYIYDIDTDQSKVFFTPKIDFNPEEYETKQIFYTSKDGTKVPMFVVHKKGIELNGKNPTLLYAYGGFNVNITPSFSIPRLVWLENGGIYVSANIRGGGEYGKAWHDAGTKLNKQNVFDDFISAAEYLVQNKYTSPEKLAVMGGSNGGLLIGAVVNQRPDLFGAAIPMVGVMDMLRFHKFTIGGSWVSDYGSSDDSTQFRYIYKYSPLHNISDTAHYPAVLVTTGDHDDRVVPAHSFKYIATLQEKYKGDKPVLIRIQTNAGHGAGKPIAITIEEQADIYSFIFKNLNVSPK